MNVGNTQWLAWDGNLASLRQGVEHVDLLQDMFGPPKKTEWGRVVLDNGEVVFRKIEDGK